MKDYYRLYLTLHKNKKCIRLHFIGQCITLVSVFLIVPFIIYPFAWTGHYLYEKNEPAAFRDPVKAKIADWMMFWDILRGKISIL